LTNVKKILLVVWFNLAWFGCVFTAQKSLDIWSLLLPLIALGLLLWVQPVSKKTALILFGLSVVGIVFDYMAYKFDLIVFTKNDFSFLPIWLISMWFLFVTILPISRPVFAARPLLAAALGFIFGPLTYYSGEAFGVMALTGWPAISIYAVFWALYFPACMIAQTKFDPQN